MPHWQTMGLQHLLLMLLGLTLLSCPATFGKMTAEQKRIQKELADKADKEIMFLDHNVLDTVIQNEAWLVFYGANWCPYTQRFTPKWLEVQNRFLQKKYADRGIHIGKVECSIPDVYHGVADFCTNHGVDGFPTVNVYINGTLIEEYPEADEIDPLMSYIDRLVVKYEEKKAAEALVKAQAQKADAKTSKLDNVEMNKTLAQAPVENTLVQHSKSNPAPYLIVAGGLIASMCGIILYRRRQAALKGAYRRVDL
ncbi:uncharacterized protein SPPG_06495 [Spizellomyces punctatus DAOM BR117]|uniref:Thioredoxin domain-containing protein n=1 Tax=Spizellomyces punctatus (strain DAOM BR117) TaxID=645134 RepID=A0A0L0HB46_SPIPD|nr:uncharacterized protein SPPG_06495 [Spizellomyces punctatus DAOM BR117]KNC98084.1 hypothetical protein SPPG_06495 [Spizellomyces punctatus DAOM BR117]|eukprot:XP_016606124.1 hypothetical protein SPPG_06495 [Spizellomyces punctatus DAOM BR117]